jgi:hypothetical protein
METTDTPTVQLSLPPAPELLTLPAAARRLGLSKPILMKILATGALPTIPCPGSTGRTPRRYIRRVDLEAYVASLAPSQGAP